MAHGYDWNGERKFREAGRGNNLSRNCTSVRRERCMQSFSPQKWGYNRVATIQGVICGWNIRWIVVQANGPDRFFVGIANPVNHS